VLGVAERKIPNIPTQILNEILATKDSLDPVFQFFLCRAAEMNFLQCFTYQEVDQLFAALD